jgi:Flp pilus assembly protein TadD
MSRAKAIAYALPLLSASLLAACASSADKEKTLTEQAIEQAMAEELAPATPEQIEAARNADPLTRANFWGKEFRKDPTKVDVTVEFMQALRAIGSHERAIEIGSKTLPLHPKSTELHIVMARALMSEARPSEAADLYYRAAAIDPHSAAAYGGLGLALDQMERHSDAQAAYKQALRIEPQRVSTLTNYGLSLALAGNLTAAESQLRKAASIPGADGRVRQNLALILGLQGKFAEAQTVDPHAPARTVEENLTTLKTMLSPVRDYGALRGDEAGDDEWPEEYDAAKSGETASKPRLRGSLGTD